MTIVSEEAGVVAMPSEVAVLNEATVPAYRRLADDSSDEGPKDDSSSALVKKPIGGGSGAVDTALVLNDQMV